MNPNGRDVSMENLKNSQKFVESLQLLQLKMVPLSRRFWTLADIFQTFLKRWPILLIECSPGNLARFTEVGCGRRLLVK